MFISQLLSDFDVKVINLEDLGCPRLSILKQQTHIESFKPCNFNHSSHNCAYINIHILLQWWNMQKHVVADITKNIDLAIKEWSERGHMMQEELIRYLPKQFILNYLFSLDYFYDKLPTHLQSDPDIVKNLRCNEHYQFAADGDEIPIKKKHCYFCINEMTSDLFPEIEKKMPVHNST